MTFRHLKQTCIKLLFFAFVWMLPLAAHSSTDEVLFEKRAKVAMRMIGHEILLCLGDHESRIMPIEKIDGLYKIPFEFEFGFDPDDIISIVDRVMTKTDISAHYIVEVEQCETKDVVHNFEVKKASDPNLTACRGRMLPKDCYNLLITLLDGSSASEVFSSDDLSLMASETKQNSPFKLVFLFGPLFLLMGLTGYFFKKKKSTPIDPNLMIIGGSQFDKRNMVLSFEDKKIELSNKEAELLSLLHSFANKPVEREVILRNVWGDEGDYVGRTLDVFISKLRKKLEFDTSVKIVNIRGVGYKLVTDFPK